MAGGQLRDAVRERRALVLDDEPPPPQEHPLRLRDPRRPRQLRSHDDAAGDGLSQRDDGGAFDQAEHRQLLRVRRGVRAHEVDATYQAGQSDRVPCGAAQEHDVAARAREIEHRLDRLRVGWGKA